MVDQGKRTAPWWFWVMALLLVGVSFYPTLAWLATTWLGSPYYAHGVLVPFISLALLWRLERQAKAETSHTARRDRSFLVGALAIIAMAFGAHSLAAKQQLHILSAGALIVVLAGVVSVLGGYPMLRRQAFPLVFLFLMIPLPWLESSTPYLARGVAALAGSMARAVGIEVIVVGARVELPGSALVIGAPCSGVNSLGALVTFAALYAFLARGPLLSRLALIILAIPIALLANLLRIWLLLVLAHTLGTDAALRYFHDWSSLLLFVLALGLLIVVGRGLRCSAIRSDI